MRSEKVNNLKTVVQLCPTQMTYRAKNHLTVLTRAAHLMTLMRAAH